MKRIVSHRPIVGEFGSGAPGAAALAADPVCEVDLGAIAHNARALGSLVKPGTALMAVVKADAYGHGAAEVARHLKRHGIGSFAVATVGEGIELRQSGIAGRILVLTPTLPIALEDAVAADLTISLGTLADAKLAGRIAAHLGKKAQAHIMVDMGLSRGGFQLSELRHALPELRAAAGLEIEGIWGHFAKVFPLATSRAIAEAFREIVGHARRFLALPLVHLASSQAIVSLPESHFTLVRPGLGLYGYVPREDGGLSLKPALRVSAPIISVKRYDAGTPVSYDGLYVTSRPSNVATVRFGYADGYEFHLSGGGAEVAIDGKRYPVVGRVTMDQILVEVGDDRVQAGQRAVLVGHPGPSPKELAARAKAIPYVILMATGRRVRRLWYAEERVGEQATATTRCSLRRNGCAASAGGRRTIPR